MQMQFKGEIAQFTQLMNEQIMLFKNELQKQLEYPLEAPKVEATFLSQKDLEEAMS